MRYIVWSPTGPTNPRQTHESRREAQRVAEVGRRLTERWRKTNPIVKPANVTDVVAFGLHLAAVDLGIEVPSAWRPE